MLWYDLPSPETQETSAWEYYCTQKMFAYDKILLAYDVTITEARSHSLVL